MPVNQQLISRFFSWWKQGLMYPLAGLINHATSKPIVLSIVDGALADHTGATLNNTQISRMTGCSVYLLAPNEQVMSKRVPDASKDLSLSQLVEQILPFNADELVVTSDPKNDTIYAILSADISDQQSEIEAKGINVIGLAFASANEYLYSDQFKSRNTGSNLNSHSGRLGWLAALLAISVPIAGMMFLSHTETEKHRELKDKLAQLELGLQSIESTSINFPPEKLTIRDSSQVKSNLQSLASALTASTRLDQLILSTEELVLDASATSATKVHANLDKSDAFGSSEFVSSISPSTDNTVERFRIKARLKESN